ncbi:M24 family metallopeptidase [Humitalea sp. 24SJ18S-53]|uniref:M24 family metallopeptidase n=1 Tax=Humitalea sp. 24SJ18S-53 TaxID=3422307 RepID=UPI003D6694D1
MLLNIDRARALMEQHGLDAILLGHPNNFIYATDYLVPSTFSFLDRPFLALLFRDPAREAVAIVPSWDFDDMRRRSWIRRVIGYTEYATDQDGDLVANWRVALDHALAGPARSLRLGVEERYLPLWISREVVGHPAVGAVVDATSIIRDIRAVKTPEEILRCRRAAEIMETAVEEMFASLHDGITEREAARVYASAVSRQGGENIANFVLGFGPASAFSHCIPEDRALRPGDVVRFDLGARYMGYHADTAVSRFWRGPTAEQARIYGAVLDSQRAAAALLRPGVPVAELYRAAIATAREVLPRFRMEHVGHGIGVEHHENPPLIGSGDVVLEANMVINVETLFLDPIHGGFAVEDTYLITPSGAEQWTGFDRNPTVGP